MAVQIGLLIGDENERQASTKDANMSYKELLQKNPKTQKTKTNKATKQTRSPNNPLLRDFYNIGFLKTFSIINHWNSFIFRNINLMHG